MFSAERERMVLLWWWRKAQESAASAAKLTDWKAHSLITWRSVEHVWVKGVCACVCVPLTLEHQPTLSPFLLGIWDDSRGRVCLEGESMCVDTVYIVCRCVGIRGGTLKEWGCHRSHDKSGMVTVILFFFSPYSLMTTSRIIAPVWGLFKQILIADELDTKVSMINMVIFSLWFNSGWHPHTELQQFADY